MSTPFDGAPDCAAACVTCVAIASSLCRLRRVLSRPSLLSSRAAPCHPERSEGSVSPSATPLADGADPSLALGTTLAYIARQAHPTSACCSSRLICGTSAATPSLALRWPRNTGSSSALLAFSISSHTVVYCVTTPY